MHSWESGALERSSSFSSASGIGTLSALVRASSLRGFASASGALENLLHRRCGIVKAGSSRTSLLEITFARITEVGGVKAVRVVGTVEARMRATFTVGLLCFKRLAQAGLAFGITFGPVHRPYIALEERMRKKKLC